MSEQVSEESRRTDKNREAKTVRVAQSRGLWRQAWRRFKNNRAALVGAGVFLLLLVVATLAPYIAPHDPLAQNIEQSFQPGFWDTDGTLGYILGTDGLGRDLLSRLIYGARITVGVASVAVSISLIAGVLVGLTAGYFGGHVDNVLMRFMDVLLAFPTIILAIAIIAILGSGISKAMIAIGVVYTPAVARVVRGSVLGVKEEEYIEAARAIGTPDLRILARHVAPNVLGPTTVYASLIIASAILDTSFLGFLGLGVQPPLPEWGTMLSQGRDFIVLGYWWVTAFPGLAIFIVVLGINLVGDGLRDALDPRSSELGRMR